MYMWIGIHVDFAELFVQTFQSTNAPAIQLYTLQSENAIKLLYFTVIVSVCIRF